MQYNLRNTIYGKYVLAFPFIILYYLNRKKLEANKPNGCSDVSAHLKAGKCTFLLKFLEEKNSIAKFNLETCELQVIS